MMPKRNLIYFCYPTAHSNEWLKNIDKITKYLDLFNGEVIVTFAFDHRTVSHEVVQEQAKSLIQRANVVRFEENDPIKCETAFFMSALEYVLGRGDKDSYTFYAHAKGVKYSQGSKRLPNIRWWRNKMYDILLGDYNTSVRYPFDFFNIEAVGCFLRHRIGTGRDKITKWHFSGTFFWFKNSALRDKELSIHEGRCGVEGFLGRNIHPSKAFCTYGYSSRRRKDSIYRTTRSRRRRYEMLKPFIHSSLDIFSNMSEDYATCHEILRKTLAHRNCIENFPTNILIFGNSHHNMAKHIVGHCDVSRNHVFVVTEEEVVKHKAVTHVNMDPLRAFSSEILNYQKFNVIIWDSVVDAGGYQLPEWFFDIVHHVPEGVIVAATHAHAHYQQQWEVLSKTLRNHKFYHATHIEQFPTVYVESVTN